MDNRLRIIGGIWRGRKISFPDRQGLRPTSDRMRETLFNWLRLDMENSTCLDLFAGSGALGFEAASRGAARVIMVDSDAEAIKSLNHHRHILGADQIQVIQADCTHYLGRTEKMAFDLVFVDPPFNRNLVPAVCGLLESGWLKPHAKIYIETELSAQPAPTLGWRVLKSERMGLSRCFLLERVSDSSITPVSSTHH
ncbi:MAG: 16S rRNA (guanine(966)-N(2))-methyltransferase RsmD [Methylococcaceae bacterium]